MVVDMGIKIPGIQFQYQDGNNLNNQTNRVELEVIEQK
jgi:hypothetical protein